jgi:hypothetical protein
MKATHAWMVAGLTVAALGAAAIIATVMTGARVIEAAAQSAQVTATPIPIDTTQLENMRFDASRYEPVFLERAKADGFTLKPRAQSAELVIVDVEPCWLERPLPDLPKDYRDLLKPGALLCEGTSCLAGYPTDGASATQTTAANQIIVDPLEARISYQRDPGCIAPTPAP